MFKASFYPRDLKIYTDIVRASVTNSMSAPGLVPRLIPGLIPGLMPGLVPWLVPGLVPIFASEEAEPWLRSR